MNGKTGNGSAANSTAEVAELLDKAEFTMREWCRLGRVKAQKKKSGRGIASEWIICHEELTRIRNEVFLPDPQRCRHVQRVASPGNLLVAPKCSRDRGSNERVNGPCQCATRLQICLERKKLKIFGRRYFFFKPGP